MLDKISFGSYLKKNREKSSLSQADVANFLGYSSRQFISNWERGISTPPMNQMIQLSKLYQIPKNEFIDKILELQQDALHKAFKASRVSNHG